ncbi:MAG: ABC-type sugar transport system ATPase subunit [Psychromonas sp.]|jgi:ABC-type sugar transport system ATPase subunit|uniref:ABC transporter ATP-binding protein n=1 Tax=Psychromonas sp. TaxID=1884585 RepID=UPI0039E25BD5
MAIIKLDKVTKSFADTEIIHGVDLDIGHGEFVVFVGPSGCGKSTLLRLIAGLEEITDGELLIDGEVMNEVDAAQRGVAMVFQSYALYPHMTVEENMGFGLKMARLSKEAVKKQVLVAAKSLQLDPLLSRKPKELSGGQRQRVAIGRAIVRDPKVFLFDEPLSNLDAELRVDMRLQIAKLHQELKNTMVYVTHDQVEAMTLATKIVVLRAGRIEQVGSPLELYHTPANQFVAGFIGSPKMNFIPCEVLEVSKISMTLQTKDKQKIKLPAMLNNMSKSAELGATVTLGIRPEHLDISTDFPLNLTFQSEVVERLGNSTYLYGQSGGIDGFKVHLPGDKKVETYQNLMLSFKEEDCHLFDANGLCLTS